MKIVLVCFSLFFSNPSLADIAPEEPSPSDESNSESDSGETTEEDKGCTAVSPKTSGTLLFPVLCLGTVLLLRRKEVQIQK